MKHLGLILILSILVSLNLPGTLVLGEEQTLLVIRKEIKFNVTVITGPDDNGTVRTIILVLDFYFINAEPSNSDINISFPVTIKVGDKVINKTVVVPLRVRGKLEKIVIVSAREESISTNNNEEGNEEIIIYYPGNTSQSISNTTSTPVMHSQPSRLNNVSTTRTVTKTVTKTKTIAIETAPTQRETTIQPTTTRPLGPWENSESTGTGSDSIIIFLGLIMIIVLTTIVILVIILVKRRTPETIHRTTQTTTPQTKQPRIPKLKCPICGEIIEPIITSDNRVICPACHNEIGRIREDGTLELVTSENKTTDHKPDEE